MWLINIFLNDFCQAFNDNHVYSIQVFFSRFFKWASLSTFSCVLTCLHSRLRKTSKHTVMHHLFFGSETIPHTLLKKEWWVQVLQKTSGWIDSLPQFCHRAPSLQGTWLKKYQQKNKKDKNILVSELHKVACWRVSPTKVRYLSINWKFNVNQKFTTAIFSELLKLSGTTVAVSHSCAWAGTVCERTSC